MKGSRRLALVLAALLLVSCIAGTGHRHAQAETPQEAAPAYVLKAVNLSFEVDAAQFQREIERYNAALSRYEGAELLAGPPKAADPDGKIRQTLDELRAQRQPFILSMDGSQLFTVQNKVLIVYQLNKKRVTLLAPDETMSQAYYDQHYQRLLDGGKIITGYNDGGFEWSPDGNYMLMTFIIDVIKHFRFGVNALLVDTAKGTIRLVDQTLPADMGVTDVDYPHGFPIRACFDPVEPVAYIEYHIAPYPQGKRMNLIKAYQLKTGEMTLLSMYPSTEMSEDPAMWYTNAGIAHTMVDLSERTRLLSGIKIHSLDGEPVQTVVRTARYEALFSIPVLQSIAGQRAALLQRFEYYPDAPSPLFRLISLNPLDSQELEFFQVVQHADNQPPQLRLFSIEQLAEYRNLFPPDHGYRFPANGALSPDGRYALLPVKKFHPIYTTGVYLYDIDLQELFAVALPDVQAKDDGTYDYFGRYRGPQTSPIRGIRWLHNNRLLVVDNRQYRLFELTPSH